jgi:hypothetical protein
MIEHEAVSMIVKPDTIDVIVLCRCGYVAIDKDMPEHIARKNK